MDADSMADFGGPSSSCLSAFRQYSHGAFYISIADSLSDHSQWNPAVNQWIDSKQ
jgi:hypothetical protein